MKPFTFSFKGRNSSEFGLIASNLLDTLLPERRRSYRMIDFKHGVHDFGNELYNERSISFDVAWGGNPIDRSILREMAEWLSGKGDLIFDIEPDKKYIGQLTSRSVLSLDWNNFEKNVRAGMIYLEFVCEPFAHEIESTLLFVNGGQKKLNYVGNIASPLNLVIENHDKNMVNPDIIVRVVKTRQKVESVIENVRVGDTIHIPHNVAIDALGQPILINQRGVDARVLRVEKRRTFGNLTVEDVIFAGSNVMRWFKIEDVIIIKRGGHRFEVKR